jgi:hypothetical protein
MLTYCILCQSLAKISNTSCPSVSILCVTHKVLHLAQQKLFLFEIVENIGALISRLIYFFRMSYDLGDD